ncbi:Pentatricopeptide repeat-containing protein, mitochondrial [Heracleum sosnowskyi]|uniref:Pentatricopeptide repeat-containing protein, mitochondrial n=1 Tax=Heracleum sosnowskyi TaxID=360622 RepID=A0AAD8HFU3_9APIA|nr:Pentatricopeptide repeat-containing protein, mitochondrial [Heracleum sosnowskyi]
MKTLYFPLVHANLTTQNQLWIQSLHANTLIFQTTFIKKNSRSYVNSHSVSSVAESSPETSLSANVSSNLCFYDHFNEFDSLQSVKGRHAQIIKMSEERNSETKMQSLVTSYLAFCDHQSAAMLFLVDSPENCLYWNSFLQEFKIHGGSPVGILQVFCDLHRKGVSFDSGSLTVILKLCANLRELCLGLEVHACLIKKGFNLDVSIKCALMNFYGRCERIDSANLVFNETPDCKFQLWNEIVLVNLRSERWKHAIELFREMQFSHVKANSFTLAKVLKACSRTEALHEGRQIHGYVIRLALKSDLLICNSLISMYCKSKKLKLARKVFDLMESRNLSSWNSIISGYSALGYFDEAWNLFNKMEKSGIKRDIITWNCLLSGHFLHGSYREVLSILRSMQLSGFKPNSSSIISILQAISELQILKFGKEIHGYVIRNGLDYDIYVTTSMLDMYVKNNDLINAQAVFDSMSRRNHFAWNTLISGYSYKGQFEEAVKLLKLMKTEGIKPDIVTYNSLVSGYAVWGNIDKALDIIRRIEISGLKPNVVSWTALISGCLQNEKYKAALEFFIMMQNEGIKPNSTTVLCLLQACAGLSFLHKGKEIHSMVIRNGFIDDVFVMTTLVYMYSKCGSLKTAYDIFQRIDNKTLATWNSMIMGFAIYSLGKQVMYLFKRMQEEGFQPDAVTFTALLSSCKASGLLNEAWRYFDHMKSRYGIAPTIEHYSCMVDLLGKCGYPDEAWEFVKSMPVKPDAAVWGALLGSCRGPYDIELAEVAANKLFKLEPYNPVNYVMMMHLYGMSKRPEDVEGIRMLMEGAGVRLGNAWSWIEINRTIHMFSATGKSHPDEGEIYFNLYKLVSVIKELGYVPDTNCVHQNIDEEEKEKILLAHTEKLAITYGLMKSKSFVPIRVIKNTRMCFDCHSLAKYISLFKRREIFVKDGARFHHFSNGKCSCNELW